MTDPPSDGLAEGWPDAEWLRRPEAAVRLGISERTLDNRVAAGKLQKRRVDDHVEILVPRTALDVRIDQGLVLLAGFTEQLTAQLRPWREDVERLARENGELQGQVAALQQELQRVSDALAEARGSPETPPRKWWQRWLGIA